MGGGAFLLTLSVVLGVLLMTLPAKINQNNVSGVNAAGVVTGVGGLDVAAYQTIELTGDSTANMQKINAATTTGNYRYVLQDNWDAGSAAIIFWGNSVILDLNGYTFTSGSPDAKGDRNSVKFNTQHNMEIADSSSAGTGEIECFYLIPNKGHLMITGGTIRATSTFTIHIASYYYDVRIYGGKVIGFIKYNFYGSNNKYAFYVYGGEVTKGITYEVNPTVSTVYTGIDVHLAPWVNATNGDDGLPTAVSAPNYFAVSASPYVLGNYNYEFGAGLNLPSWELLNLTEGLPADKTYYLWVRNADGKYVYLNIVYRGGAWVKE